MQPYQTSQASQADKFTTKIILAQRLWLVKTNAGRHNAAEQPESPAKKDHNAFPTPVSTKSDPEASFCPTYRLLALYNKQQGKKQKRLTNVVREWFKEAAHQVGWHEVEFLQDIQTGQIAGCMLSATLAKGTWYA